VRGTYIRHFWHIFIGFIIQFYIYNTQIQHVYVLTGVAYLLMIVVPRQMQANVVMLWVIGHLSVTHVYRLLADQSFAIEISTFNMLQVCKLSALAFCYKDGDSNSKAKLNERQEAQKVKTLPNPIELLSYTLFT